MAKKLFNEVQTGYDPQNRQVMICKGKNGFYVYKPHTGFTSRCFESETDEALREIFGYQVACMHNAAYYREGDREVIGTPKKVNGKPAKVKPAKELPSPATESQKTPETEPQV